MAAYHVEVKCNKSIDEVTVMAYTTQKDKAVQFRSLHSGSPILVLPNAWDAASARIFEQAGFPAIATTSSGVAASLGYADGQRISRDMMVEATERIVKAVSCPVSADIEAGYGDTIEEVLQTVRAIRSIYLQAPLLPRYQNLCNLELRVSAWHLDPCELSWDTCA